MSESQALEVVKPPAAAAIMSAADFMPLFTVQQAVERKELVNQFIGSVLKDELDYGKMPGGRIDKVLLKPGAEKLCSIFGLAPRMRVLQEIEDWTGAEHGGEPLFYYKYVIELYRGDRFMGEAIGSANSWESKHRYRWVSPEEVPERFDILKLPTRGGKKTLFEFDFALDKRETSGKYGKPAEYWDAFEAAIKEGRARKAVKKTKSGDRPGVEFDVDLTLYRIPNPDGADVVNTCQKIAYKRALVAAVLVVTNCSDAFKQDLEDASEPPGTQRNTPAEQAELAERRIQETRGDGPQTAGESPASHVTPPSQPAVEIPGQLKLFFLAIDEGRKGAIREGFDLLKKQLVEAMPENGERAYQDILKRHGIEQGRTMTPDSIKACWLALWRMGEFARNSNASPSVATDSDVPFEPEPAAAEVSK